MKDLSNTQFFQVESGPLSQVPAPDLALLPPSFLPVWNT